MSRRFGEKRGNGCFRCWSLDGGILNNMSAKKILFIIIIIKWGKYTFFGDNCFGVAGSTLICDSLGFGGDFFSSGLTFGSGFESCLTVCFTSGFLAGFTSTEAADLTARSLPSNGRLILKLTILNSMIPHSHIIKYSLHNIRAQLMATQTSACRRQFHAVQRAAKLRE